ncbi:MAG TPA: hypothetical protein VGR56_04110 [Nitrososphaerales archaeon]|nr:hypothetical protein [Nitrososphaerales archaeon]
MIQTNALAEVGSYETVGFLQWSWSNPRIFLSVPGIFAFLVAFIGGAFSPWPISEPNFIFLLQVSLAISFVSIFALGFFTLTTPPQGKYEITIATRNNDGKRLVNYTDPKGRRKANLVVRKYKAYPTAPMPMRGKGFAAVGTKSSCYICFERPRITMWLGFPNSQELDRFKSLLTSVQ